MIDISCKMFLNVYKCRSSVFYSFKNVFVRYLATEVGVKTTIKDDIKKIRITTTQKVEAPGKCHIT